MEGLGLWKRGWNIQIVLDAEPPKTEQKGKASTTDNGYKMFLKIYRSYIISDNSLNSGRDGIE